MKVMNSTRRRQKVRLWGKPLKVSWELRRLNWKTSIMCKTNCSFSNKTCVSINPWLFRLTSQLPDIYFIFWEFRCHNIKKFTKGNQFCFFYQLSLTCVLWGIFKCVKQAIWNLAVDMMFHLHAYLSPTLCRCLQTQMYEITILCRMQIKPELARCSLPFERRDGERNASHNNLWILCLNLL